MFQHQKQGAIDILTSEDIFDEGAIESATIQISRCIKQGQPKVVMNLENVPLLDSSALDFLLEARDQCRSRGGSLKIASPNALCEEILHITGMNEHVEIYDDVITASGSFVQ